MDRIRTDMDLGGIEQVGRGTDGRRNWPSTIANVHLDRALR